MNEEFELCDSFYVDDGELDGLSPQQCFVLGYELSSVLNTIENSNHELNFTVHASNKFRLEKALNKRNKSYKWQWPHDDISEAWIYLKILND